MSLEQTGVFGSETAAALMNSKNVCDGVAGVGKPASEYGD